MKESSIDLPKTIRHNPTNQCHGKKQYKLKRRALNDARSLVKEYPEEIFSVYLCPHCGKYHVGRVRKE